MTIEQIRIGFDNYSYIIYCLISKKAAIVDPGFNTNKLLENITTKDLDLEYIILTHYHSDHSGDCQKIKDSRPAAKIVASEPDGARLDVKIDIYISDGNYLKIGKVHLDFILTPGHTPGGICIIVDNEAILTGDTLFIGDCGRTDLSGGSLSQMYNSLHEKIKPLPDHLIVYPGHDYGEKPFDTLGNQKKTNRTLLAKNLKEFSKIP
jgi:glyoxylase-like metal-dependent hydrolase (beta-lactamase superfamily II)